jgi:hypothetical protein
MRRAGGGLRLSVPRRVGLFQGVDAMLLTIALTLCTLGCIGVAFAAFADYGASRVR